jgi:U3 small nucleolar RNA-associated protein 20
LFTDIFDAPGLGELLAAETIKNLLFLGQCSAATDLKLSKSHETEMEHLKEEDSSTTEGESKRQTAVKYLFRRLSFVLRREISPPRAPALIPKTTALKLIRVLVAKLSAETILPSLQTILWPLHNLTDPNIPIPYSTDDVFKTGHAALKTSCQEVMTLLQNKFGTAEYTAQLLQVRGGVKAKRAERSGKRKIEAITAPEKFGRDKKKKTERKKERRKEKGLEHREQRRGHF